jgi:SulP family sulfate permease
MVLSVSVGVMLAALLFMRRMAELTDVKLDTGTMQKLEMPEGVSLYEIAGPLFFGAAERAVGALQAAQQSRPGVVILFLGQVPAIDATGLVAFESLMAKLQRAGHKVILAGVKPAVVQVLERAGIKRDPGKLAYAPDVETAVSMAIVHSARRPTNPQPATV